MANAKEQAKYESKRLQTVKKLKAKGFEGSFGEKKTVNHRGTAFNELCKEFYFPLDKSDYFTDLGAGEFVIMVSNQNNGVFETCDFMKDKTIVKKKPFPEGSPVIIFYEAVIRG